jgi:hypothetical protein
MPVFIPGVILPGDYIIASRRLKTNETANPRRRRLTITKLLQRRVKKLAFGKKMLGNVDP